MKKYLVALAALTGAHLAVAQSSVTLFGVLDTSISSVSNRSVRVTNPASALANPWASAYLPGALRSSRTGMNHSASAPSRLGFRGVEDLGGGYSAGFWLEAPIGNDDGSVGLSNFSRRSTVSVAGPFGEVRLGRDYKPSFWNYAVFDPFGTNGAGTALPLRAAIPLESSVVRASNSISYFLPANLGGMYGQAMYAFHEQTKYGSSLQGTLNDNSRGGRYVGGRLGYAAGPLDMAIAYGEQANASSWLAGTDTVARNFNAGASYNFGAAKLFGYYATVKTRTEASSLAVVPAPASRMRGYLVGVTVPVGVGQILVSYGHVRTRIDQNPLVAAGNPLFPYRPAKADQLALGYVHNLSKRTALYATVAYIRNRNGANYTTAGLGNIAAPWVTANGASVYEPRTSLGYDFGIRHAF